MNDPADAWDKPDFSNMLDHLPKPIGSGEWTVTNYSGYHHASQDDRECISIEWSRDGAVEFVYLVAEAVRS
ncbi:hypothetical protein G4X40_19915 [Rhodococcus sp. D2-41]|uniref:hypothetical protein n=1 Tax=Speluncibacter jeojiensis TaxID=2710754 RepID=UPI00241018DB|nr:hypothetical protein [Rhodococcus sp. D2-41]MDG3012410.1 hypothetical protein [Rhodococcus sp. D2-41]